jgi:hypothetical protein
MAPVVAFAAFRPGESKRGEPLRHVACLGLCLLLACASGPSTATPTAPERLSGKFAENTFSTERVHGLRVQMARRPDGTWGGLFPCSPWLSHASNELCATDFDQTPESIRVSGHHVFGVRRNPVNVLLTRPPLEYEFALADGRPFPADLVMPLFLAVLSARDLRNGLTDASENARFYDNQSRFIWVIEVEELGRIGIRRGPSP